MRRITLWFLSTVTAVVLLFSYRTSTGSGSTTATGLAAAAGVTTTSTGTSTGNGTGTSTSTGKTYTGTVAQTRWGPVQVAITVTNNKITSVSVPIYPDGNGRDAEINARALPVLRQETIDAQNAQISTVSGATVTSDGYIQSLQAAITAAGIG